MKRFLSDREICTDTFFPFTLQVQIQYIVFACFMFGILEPHDKALSRQRKYTRIGQKLISLMIKVTYTLYILSISEYTLRQKKVNRRWIL